MGMPMNRFAMLKKLRDDIKKGKSPKFVLSAVIVHDPNDRELVNCIQKNFVNWAELTGKHFLFVTFVPPSDEWRMSEYSKGKMYVDERYLVTDENYTHEDEKNTMPLLRDFMALPEDGSYLMLTSDLTGEDFHPVRITAESVEGCLTRITRYCEEGANGTEHSRRDFQTLLQEINAEDLLSGSLIDILLDITSIYSKADNRMYNDEQKERADSVIRRVKEQLRCAEGKDYEEKLFRLCMNMEAMLRNLKEGRNPLRGELEYEYRYSFSKLNRYSMKLLNTYYILKDAIKEKDDIDYSCLTMCLGKIVENEANLSIYQMLRYVMGVDMPQYYNRYCAGMRGRYILAGENRVYLNPSVFDDNDDGKELTEVIPVGNLVWAYCVMRDGEYCGSYPPIWERFYKLSNDLLEFLYDFTSKYRNLAAHLDDRSDETYEGATEAFREFMSRFLSELFSIRCRLDSRGISMR